MKIKYEKPISRSLGDYLPIVQGNCRSGSLAGSVPPCTAGTADATPSHCGVGTMANGTCNNGSNASGVGTCTQGTGVA